MRWTSWIGLLEALHFVQFVVSASPPIQAQIKTSWPAPSLETQILETIALEDAEALFPFIHQITSTSVDLDALPRDILLSTSMSALRQQRNSLPSSLPLPHPIFSSNLALTPNETYSLFELALKRSAEFGGLASLESFRMSLAARETSVILESMRIIWKMRERELDSVHLIGGLAGGECETLIEIAGRMICSVENFWALVGENQKQGTGPIKLPESPLDVAKLYPFDHLLPANRDSTLPLIVLWANPTSAHFPRLFNLLYSLSVPNAAAGVPARIQFVLRWKPADESGQGFDDEDFVAPRLVLSGFGAGLDIKKSDYLAVDDRATSQADTNEQGRLVDLDSEENSPKILPLKKREIAKLGVRSAAYILAAEEPFQAFADLTASFPQLASQLKTLLPEIDVNLTAEIRYNQQFSAIANPTKPSFSLNGLFVAENLVEPFNLLKMLRKERKFITDLQSLHANLQPKMAREILIQGGNENLGQAKHSQRDSAVGPEVLGEIFDAGDLIEGGNLIFWLNDLEKDSRYKTWSSELKHLLRPSYPGQMQSIRRNLNNVIFALDLSQPEHLSVLVGQLTQLVSRAIPVRFGIVPFVHTSPETGNAPRAMAQILWYLAENLGKRATIDFLGQLLNEKPIQESLLRKAYLQLSNYMQKQGEILEDYNNITQSSASSKLLQAEEWAKRLGLSSGNTLEKSLNGAIFINGVFSALEDDWIGNLQRTIQLHTQFIQQQIYFNTLTDPVDMNRYFFELPTSFSRRNRHIAPTQEINPFKAINLVDVAKSVDDHVMKSLWIENSSEAEEPILTSLFVLANLDSDEGSNLAKSALKILSTSQGVRVALIHTSANDPTQNSHPPSFSRVLYSVYAANQLEQVSPADCVEWLESKGKDLSQENPLKSFSPSEMSASQGEAAQTIWTSGRRLADFAGIAAGENGLIINGRVISNFQAEEFSAEDFQSLVNYELTKRILPVVHAITASELDKSQLEPSQLAHLYNLATSIVTLAHVPELGGFAPVSYERRTDYLTLSDSYSLVDGPNESSALFEIVVVLDPATELAQRWAQILLTLSKLQSVHLKLYLNPTLRLTELPIKRFYQYSFQSRLLFDSLASGGQEIPARVKFEQIPEDVLFNFALDAHPSWVAFPKVSIHDLDNIKLKALPARTRSEGVSAEFELENLLLEGHAREIPAQQPPRGLQLELVRNGEADKRADTIVMANLGYFQLKATPGPWQLNLRAGASAQIYSFESIGAPGAEESDLVNKTGNELFVTSLQGLTIFPIFLRNRGFETADLLSYSHSSQIQPKTSLTIENLLGQTKKILPFLFPKRHEGELAVKKPPADINVFTVASGLLYERMAFLMMVSVLRHTKSSVKFWFIQNFLSPSFRAFIPHMALEYDFEYELITYSWPHWLRAQKEKQRTIWGYKILFLDVLFPLELKKVIFVDSDQIVRTDLLQLVELDLRGAVYAYTPMGDDRREMDGFRFWKTGYWANHLRGKPYHISALYVIDLDKFRAIAAGDRLRQQYQGLSADPNSLANLDQDLPNNMQDEIPIFSLDRSWLWCETWCSDETLPQAKTIDLCNNPLTKEPKLQRAKRLIPEWTVYDNEVAALAKRVAAAEKSATGSIDAFGQRAEELGQAAVQQQERDELVKEKFDQGKEAPSEIALDRVKDEL